MDRIERYVPWVAALLGVGYVLGSMSPGQPERDAQSKDPRDRMHLRTFGALPILDQGRFKPFDTYARNELMQLSRRQEYHDSNGRSQPAVRWLLDLYASGLIRRVKTVEIPDAAVREWLDLKPRRGFVYDVDEIIPNLRKRAKEFDAIDRKDEKDRTALEKKVYETAERVMRKATLADEMDRSLGATDSAGKLKTFRVDYDQLIHMLRLERRPGLRFSAEEIINGDGKGDHFSDFLQVAFQAGKRAQAKKELDTTAQRALDLRRMLGTHSALAKLEVPTAVPSADFRPAGWMSPADALNEVNANPAASHFEKLLTAYALGDADTFNKQVAEYGAIVRKGLGRQGAFLNMEEPAPEGVSVYTASFAGLYFLGFLSLVGAVRYKLRGLAILAGCFLVSAVGMQFIFPAYLKMRADTEIASLTYQEAWFSQFSPFYRCALLYVGVLVLAVVSWGVWRKPLLRAAFALFLVAAALHTFALFFRMHLQGRPPVTNLYSSAVFIGWGCTLVCLYLDWRIYWNGIATAAGALLGFGTMVIAHFLGGSGDSLAVLQAVLDTNFWLATHVTTVTLGYTATFVAGFLAIAWLWLMLAGTVAAFFRNRGNPEWNNGFVFVVAALGVSLIPAAILTGLYWGLLYVQFDEDPSSTVGAIGGAFLMMIGLGYAVLMGMRYLAPMPEDKPGEVPPPVAWIEAVELNHESSKGLSNAVYGVVCFAVLLSFVGTVLGGIWADQSWGRFWGWDPKENGAILVVIINALILHARWGGMIKERGMVILALIGNMVTMWSWFGTNQLGIGLHSYGFNKALIAMCSNFWVSQLALIGLASLPGKYWKAYAARPETATARAATGMKGKKGKGGTGVGIVPAT